MIEFKPAANERGGRHAASARSQHSISNTGSASCSCSCRSRC